jgi:hypothetical protein
LIGAGILSPFLLFSYIIPESRGLENRWFIGFGIVALIVGSVVTWAVRRGLLICFKSIAPEKDWGLEPSKQKWLSLHRFLLGVFERSFFAVLVAFEVQAVAASLILWITVKMLSGWNRMQDPGLMAKVHSFNARLCNLTSLGFAVVGGLIINGNIQLCFLYKVSGS